ncbi:MAG: tRNA (adenosine(37)-N6)-threonylcarbamoyltransferase complex transferase subunit TsaD, partial [Candidatus Portnoybacteria bacterium]
MTILGIETSCDDTSVAIIKGGSRGCSILSSIVSSQIKVHAPYGGVVPNLAARAHLENIKPVLEQAIKEAGNPKIDLIAATKGPGLIPCLLVGVNFAKALAYSWDKPIVGINHLEGHLYANLIKNPKINFPALGLIVSGGHTQLVLMKDHGQYQLLGETRDDAAGEAFDKVAKLLGLGYPGGPEISKRAEKGNANTFNLPRPMISSKDFDFSFSGLKTAVLYQVKKIPKITPELKSEICYEFEQAVADVLVLKTIKASKELKVKTIMISGGVAANIKLREEMTEKVKKELPQVELRIPEITFCTDNAVMIAAVACFRKLKAQPNGW